MKPLENQLRKLNAFDALRFFETLQGPGNLFCVQRIDGLGKAPGETRKVLFESTDRSKSVTFFNLYLSANRKPPVPVVTVEEYKESQPC